MKRGTAKTATGGSASHPAQISVIIETSRGSRFGACQK
jgi:hypothetical protein